MEQNQNVVCDGFVCKLVPVNETTPALQQRKEEQQIINSRQLNPDTTSQQQQQQQTPDQQGSKQSGGDEQNNANNKEQEAQQQQLPVQQQKQQFQDLYKLKEGDPVILFGGMNSIKLIYLQQGEAFQDQQGRFPHSSIIGLSYGDKVNCQGKGGYKYILRPGSNLITESLSHQTQILYHADISLILMKLNIKPGSIVVESGTGSGSLSCSILNTIQESGHLFTFEFNEERFKKNQQQFQKLGYKNVDVIWRDVLTNGFLPKQNEIYNLKPNSVNAVFLDLPQPYQAIQWGRQVLKQGGRLCCFSPCIEQVQKNSAELTKLGFIEIVTIEVLQRKFEKRDKEFISPFEINEINTKRTQQELNAPSNQPIQNRKYVQVFSNGAQQMKGHTGYLTFAMLQ